MIHLCQGYLHQTHILNRTRQLFHYYAKKSFALRYHSSRVPSQTYRCDVDAEPLRRYKPGGYHPVTLGDVLHDGRYRILHKLGWGGYSTTWAAKDQEFVFHATRNGYLTNFHAAKIDTLPSKFPFQK